MYCVCLREGGECPTPEECAPTWRPPPVDVDESEDVEF